MNTTRMILLEELESQVEGHIEIAIKIFQNLTFEQLLIPAKDGGWSIAQCLDHLNGYGRYYLPLILNKIEHYKGDSSNEKFRSSMMGSYFTKMMDPKTGKRKMKAFKNHLPVRELDAMEVVAEFIQQQEVLLKAITKAHNVDLNKISIPISISKWIKLSLGDTFGFLIAHNERHIQQAKRNL
jgi:hypothetical protein